MLKSFCFSLCKVQSVQSVSLQFVLKLKDLTHSLGIMLKGEILKK